MIEYQRIFWGGFRMYCQLVPLLEISMTTYIKSSKMFVPILFLEVSSKKRTKKLLNYMSEYALCGINFQWWQNSDANQLFCAFI